MIAVADVNESSATAFAKKWGADKIFTSADALAESGAVDAAHITTPPDSHAALAAVFLKADVATFVVSKLRLPKRVELKFDAGQSGQPSVERLCGGGHDDAVKDVIVRVA